MSLDKPEIGVGLIVCTAGYLVSERMELPLQGVYMLESFHCTFEDGALSVGNHLLREVSNGLTRGYDDGATLWFLLSTKDFQ